MRHPLVSSLLALLLMLSLTGAVQARRRYHHRHERRHHHETSSFIQERSFAPMPDDTSGGAQVLERVHRYSHSNVSPGPKGTKILFVEPGAGIRPVIGALASARQSIDLVVYLLTDARVISALEQAKDRGVRVRVLLEPHPYGSGPGNRRSYDKLQQLDIPVRYAPNRFRYTHEKAFVIDHHLALISTTNFTRSAFSRNREYGYFDSLPADVREIEGMFEADWKDQPYFPPDSRLVVSPTNSRRKIVDLIRSARRFLLIQDETISDPEVIRAIAQRQAAGVTVRVEVEENRDLDRLQEAGIPAQKFEGRYLHAKAIVVDGSEAYVGSENLTANSLDHNRELGVVLKDPVLVDMLGSIIRSSWHD